MIEPLSGLDHLRRKRLDGEEVVTQIRVDPIVEVFGCHVAPVVSIVAGGIVDEHVDTAHRFDRERAGLLQRRDVQQVDVREPRCMCGPPVDAAGHRCRCGVDVPVDEEHPGPLPSEFFDHCAADPRRAAREEDTAVGERWVGGVLGHGNAWSLCCSLVSPGVSGRRHRRRLEHALRR